MKAGMIIGVDEAGRGPWAGPLCASCVLIKRNQTFKGLRDSKRMTPKTRESMQITLKKQASSIGVGWASVDEIDSQGLSYATKLAMMRAYRQIPKIKAEVIVDGAVNYLEDVDNSSSLVRADMTVQAVSAASCIAKYHRDMYMQSLARQYPEYGFSLHKGYGTKLHQEALNLHGVSICHRRSFAPIKAIVEAEEA